MKIFSAEDVREIDQYTISNEPIASIDLMERAASRFTHWFTRKFRVYQKVLVFAGPGNNGGDALAIARMLAERQYTVECFLLSPSGKLADDCAVNLDRLKEQGRVSISRIKGRKDFPSINAKDLVIDGIFGSGLSRPAEGIYLESIRHINEHSARVISIDIPSGLFGEDNRKNSPDSIVRASYTLTFQFPFLSFFFSENHAYTGKWQVLDIGLHPGIIQSKESVYSLVNKEEVAAMLPYRGTFAHKGSFGHALLIAGSYGMMGAALLSGIAALRSGTGLVTLHVPELGYNIVQSAFPEAIVSIDANSKYFSKLPDLKPYSAIGAGPGLGTSKPTANALKMLLEKISVPLVLDADALNIIAADPKLLELIPKNSILTPHPREFDRILGNSSNSFDRHLKQQEFSRKNELLVILKGAYTCVSTPEGRMSFNPSGNPGMATGGSGDVLSGIIVSLLAQGMKAADAAIAAVYIHGMAGDLASGEEGEEGLIAGDIARWVGKAIKKIKSTPFIREERK